MSVQARPIGPTVQQARVSSTPAETGTELSRWGAAFVAVAAFVVLVALALVLPELGPAAWLGLLAFVAGAVVLAATGLREAEADIDALTDGVDQMIASEQPEAPIAIRALDELGELTRGTAILSQRFVQSLRRSELARARAEAADRYKTEFLGTVRHELRTPLNAILGFAEVLLREIDGPLNDEQREDLEIIHASGKNLMDLFNNVLDLSAAASGQLALAREPVDVEPLLQTVAGEHRPALRGGSVQLAVNVQSGLPPLDADPRRLRQVLNNLVSNAIKFTERGHVELRAQDCGDAVEICVADSGVGIAPDQLERIFEQFVQTGNRRQRRKGSGLGLAICQEFIALHGGEITAQSTPGGGTTFTLRLGSWRT